MVTTNGRTHEMIVAFFAQFKQLLSLFSWLN